MSSIVGERQFGRRILRDNLVARVIESQKLPRDSGESIFAARHQDASQGPLGPLPKQPPSNSVLRAEKKSGVEKLTPPPRPVRSKAVFKQGPFYLP